MPTNIDSDRAYHDKGQSPRSKNKKSPSRRDLHRSLSGPQLKIEDTSKIQRQVSVSRDEDETKLRRPIHKQESKDSGIVTEMYTRPKEYSRTDSKSALKVEHSLSRSESRGRGDDKTFKSTGKEIARSASDCKTLGKKSKSDNSAKRSASMKTTRDDKVKSRDSIKKKGSSSDLKDKSKNKQSSSNNEVSLN